MAAPKGHEWNKGKQNRLGTQNKVKLETKVLVVNFMQHKFEEVSQAWERLEDADKVKTYISLMKYIMPTLSSVKLEDNSGKNIIEELLSKQKTAPAKKPAKKQTIQQQK